MDQLLVVFTLCFLSIVPLSYQQNLDDQINANTVIVQFDKNYGELLELEEWNIDNMATPTFKDITAEVATNYCLNSLEDCSLVGLDPDSGFSSGDVMLTDDPIFYNGDIRFGVYISLENKNVNESDQLVILKKTLKDILKDAQDDYETGLAKEGIGYNITLMFVDDVRVGPTLDYTVNIIMIVVSLLILLAACFLACVLKCKEDMEQNKKLKGAGGQGTHPAESNDAAENLTLTAIKPAADDDSKEPSEGSMYSWKNKVVPFRKSSFKTQETQTSGRVVFIPEGEPGESNSSPILPGTPEPGLQQHCETSKHHRKEESSHPELSKEQKPMANVDTGETALKISVESSNSPAGDGGKSRSSRHNILPPLGETVVHEMAGELAGPTLHGGTDGSESDGMNEKKHRKKRRKNKKKKNLASDDENNDLLNESQTQRALSPLGEEVAPKDS